MKKCLSLVLSFLLLFLFGVIPSASADVDTSSNGSIRITGNAIAPIYPLSTLSSLTHNCPNTGIMEPSSFTPQVTSYLLTVASWVSRVTLTPTAMDTHASITVNGVYVPSGHTSQEFVMTDQPQTVTITVSSSTGTTTYTVFLQRRPSEARTRVSYGYLTDFYQRGNVWYTSFDLYTATYEASNSSTVASYTNQSTYQYKYKVADNCLFLNADPSQGYYRYATPAEFYNAWMRNQNKIYYVVYIEDKVVAIVSGALNASALWETAG